MAILSGKALAEARRKKGWTQDELSKATKVDVSTISRIERGKPTRARSNTLNALAKALEVHPESLCPTAKSERDVIKLRIGPAARNALALVARRYAISRESIVEIAPLLFFIAAEQSLQKRQKHIAKVRDAAGDLFDLYSGIRHLPPYWPDEGAVSSEEQSIKIRDLFGKKVLVDAQHFIIGDLAEDYDEAEQDPFVAFLRDNLAQVSNSREAAESVSWTPGLWPSYSICTEEAADLVGNDEEATIAIVSGAAALHEMPKGSPEQRAEWARAERDRKDSDLYDLFGCIAGPSPAESQACDCGEAS